MDIDSAREASDDKALNSGSDLQPQPERVDTCVICGEQADMIEDGCWATNTHIEHDHDGAYLLGDILDGAKVTPWGWVCSDTCYSQAVYNACDCKAELNAVVDACRVLAEHGERVANFINMKTALALNGGDLIEIASDFLDEIHDADSPAWLNRATRAEALEAAAEKAAWDAERLALVLCVYARYSLLHEPFPITPTDAMDADIGSRRAATAGNIALDLREAIKEAE